MFKRLIDSPVAWSFCAALLRLLGSFLVLPLVLRKLPTEELGLWYVFLSVGGITGLFDFGFNPTMTRVAGYVWGGAQKLQGIGLHHDASENLPCPNFPLMIRLVGTMRCYYRCLAGIIFFFLLTGGSWWIIRSSVNLQNHNLIIAAWVLFAFGIALNTSGGLWPALLTGVNGVKESQRLFTLSLVVNYLIIPIGLFAHLGIMAMALGQISMGMVVRIGGRIYFKKIAGSALNSVNAVWDKEIFRVLWPMSWRNGLLSIGTFLINNVNTLICSAYLGLAVTASYGLTLQVVGFLNSISFIWVSVKHPYFNQLRILNRLDEMTMLFIQRMRFFVMTYGLGSFGILFFGDRILALFHAKTHLLSPQLLGIYLLINFLEINSSQYAYLIVTENVMPFMKATLISGLAVMAFSLWLTPLMGIWGMILAFGGTQLCYNNWWCVWRGIKSLNIKTIQFFKIFLGIRKMFIETQ
jgi:O-antigen/teichoic acid export membrane protein